MSPEYWTPERLDALGRAMEHITNTSTHVYGDPIFFSTPDGFPMVQWRGGFAKPLLPALYQQMPAIFGEPNDQS